MTQVRQLPAVGSNAGSAYLGGVGRHIALPTGTTPVHGSSEPSFLARSITWTATARPRAYPASTSLRYATPAATRASPASRASAWKAAVASIGNRYVRTSAA